MAKVHEWEVPVDGTVYHISCQERGNQYDFRLDGEHLQRLIAGSDEMREQNVTIGGKRCQLVVYDGVPDVAVDGILVGVDAAERRAEKRRRLTSILLGILLVCLGTLAVFSYALMTLAGQTFFGGVFPLIFGIAFAAAGVWLLLRSRVNP